MGAWNRVQKPYFRVFVPVRQATWAGGISSLESIPGLLKSLKIPAQDLENVSPIDLLGFIYL